MDSLAKEDNIRELEESLQRLPEDLDRTYDDALERIKHQDSRKRARAEQVFTLISCAKRPLSLEVMRQALSIRSGDTFLDPRALPRTESLISACCGLVVIEGWHRTVRLVHYTTEEYFRRKLQHYRSPEAHRYFAGILVTYLSFTVFATFSQDKMVEDQMKTSAVGGRDLAPWWVSRREKKAVDLYLKNLFANNILLPYAAENWGYHARIAFKDIGYIPDPCLATVNCRNQEHGSWNLEQLIPDFLGKKPNISCANEVIHYFETMFNSWHNQVRCPEDVTELQIAASMGIRYLVEYYLKQGVELGARDSEGMTALHKAAKHGHLEIVQLLLVSGALIETLDRKGRSALTWSVSTNEIAVSKLLLQRGSKCRFKGVHGPGFSETSIAATAGHEEMLELLAEHERDDSKRNQLMREALLDAASSGHEGVVRLLMRDGKKWAISKQYSAKAMVKATSEGHVKVMMVLLKAGVDVNPPIPPGTVSLAKAPAQGNLEGTQRLLTAAAVLSLEGSCGELPLHAAVRIVNVRAVALLLDNGADVNARNLKGETAMVVLAKSLGAFSWRVSVLTVKDSVSIMQLLLERGVDTAARDCELNRTSLEWVVIHGYSTLVWLLHERGTFTAIRKNVMIYLTRLYNAIWKEDHSTLEQLHREKSILELESIPELLLVYIPAKEGYQDVLLTFL